MRDYAKLSPFFWTRGSGKRLRGDAVAQVVATYLSTSPLANMIGVYYVALATIANDTGVALDDVRGALGRIEKAGYAFYDFEAELVWIPNHARFEVGPTMAPGDKRRKKLTVEVAQVGDHRFAADFLDAYGEAFGLPMRRGIRPPDPKPHGASADREPIRSDPIRSDQGRDRARTGLVSLDLPIEQDAHDVWGQRTFTRSAGKPIEDVWADFVGHFAGQDLRGREGLLGRWSKWVGKQCEIADKERQADYDRKARQDASMRSKGPPPAFSEPQALTPEQQAELARRVPMPVRKRSA